MLPKRYGPVIGNATDIPSAKMAGRTNGMRYALRMAEIIRIDYEKMVCDLAYIQGETPNAEEVPITSAYWSPRSFLGGMPEEGSVVIVGFAASHQNRHTKPFILTYLPGSVQTSKNFDPIGAIPRDADGLDLPQDKIVQELSGYYGPTRHKFRKIYPGDIMGMSRQGSELILDSGIRMYDPQGSEFCIENAQFISACMDSLGVNAAGRSSMGRVIRNALSVPTDFLLNGKYPSESPLFESMLEAGLIFEDGSLVPDVNAGHSIVLPDGRRQKIITRNGVHPNDQGSRSYTERRFELSEYSDGRIPSNPIHGHDVDAQGELASFTPFITSVSGTLVGNSPWSTQGRALYGKLLRPTLFDQASASQGSAGLEIANTEVDESLVAAKYYSMRRPDGQGELFYAHDKEGHIFFSVPASSSKDAKLGAGRSVEGEFKGSAKLVLGANKRDNESLDLHAEGGFLWVLGALRRSGKSLDMTARGGFSVEVLNPDLNGDAARLVLRGNSQTSVDGNVSLASTGDHLEEALGLREITAEAYSLQVGIGDYNETVTSNKNVTLLGKKTESLGEGEERTILTGGSETSILQGNSTVSFGAPSSRSISFLSSGTHSITSSGALTLDRRASVSATYNFQAPSGSYSVALATGNIALSSGGSRMDISPDALRVTAANISLTGSVSLGSATATNSVVGGIPGPSPHLDYITGLPLTGNPLVRTL